MRSGRPSCGGCCANASGGRARPNACWRPATDLRAEPGLLDLPPRLSLFGLTRLPASYLDVLDAVAAGRDVHLFLLHPSPVLWERLSDQAGPESRFLVRSQDPTASAPRNPLLASWGRDAREMQLVLGGAITHGDAVPGVDAARYRGQLSRPTPTGRDGRVPPAPAPGGRALRPHPGRCGCGGGRRGRSPPDARPRGRERPRAFVSRPRTPGRGPARRHPPSARRRSHPRTPGHHRHVSRHRELRPADPGHFRGP